MPDKPNIILPHKNFRIVYTNGERYKTVLLAYKAATKWKDSLPPSHEVITNNLPLYIKITNTEITFNFSNI